jgi:hypothetical protein
MNNMVPVEAHVVPNRFLKFFGFSPAPPARLEVLTNRRSAIRRQFAVDVP